MKMWELFKNFGVFKQIMDELEKALEEIEVSGTAGNGMVKIFMNGAQKVLKIEINSELLDKKHGKLIEEILCDAFNDALEKSRKKAEREVRFTLEKLKEFPPYADA